MLIQVDDENQKIKIYTDSKVFVFPFGKVREVASLIENQKVYYISEIVETNSEDILNLVRSINNQSVEDVVSSGKNDREEKRWLHATGSGFLNLKNFIFSGPIDFKPLHEIGFDVIEKDIQLKNMIKRGLVKVIGIDEVKKIKQAYKAKLDKKDKELSSIVLETSVKDLDLKNMSQVGKNIPDMEVEEDNFETEEEKLAKELGTKEEK